MTLLPQAEVQAAQARVAEKRLARRFTLLLQTEKYAQLRPLLEKTTPGEWFVRRHPEDPEKCFVQSNAPRKTPYGVEIMGEDTYDYPWRTADVEFVALAHEFLKEVLIGAGGS